MAVGDIKSVRENTTGGYDEFLLNKEFPSLIDIMKRMMGCLLTTTDIYPAVVSPTLSTFSFSDGRVLLTTLFVEKTTTVTGIKFVMSTTGNYTGDNTNGFCLYSKDTSGDGCTKVTGSEIASSEIWKSGGLNTAAFDAPLQLAAGEYKIALLYNQSAQTTAPAIYTIAQVSATKDVFNNLNFISGRINSQSTLPATIATSAVSLENNVPYLWLYV